MSAAEKLSGPLLRPMRESDKAFIFNSWLKSYWDGWWKYMKEVHPGTYWQEQWEWINRFLARQEASVTIAAAPEEHDVITAWIASEMIDGQPAVHYVYVKEAFREQGMLRLLLDQLPGTTFVYTHVTRRALPIIEKLPRASYNPWILSR